MAKITAHRAADGALSYRVQFRPRPGANPTRETFETADAARRFIDLAADIGWAGAQEIRDASGGSDTAIPTLATWLERHLDELASSATPGTIDGYRREAARTWLPRLGRMPLDMLTRERITSWVAWQRKQETARSARARAKAIAAGEAPPPAQLVADKTIANAHGLLSAVLSAAGRRYGLPNPAEGVRLPSDGEAEEMVFLTAAEYDRLLGATPEYWQPLVALLAGTGCRWGEATALRASDFDLDADVPVVRISRAWKRGERGGVYLGSPKTRRGRRTVTLDPTTVGLVRGLVDKALEDGRPDELLFVGARGGRVAHQNFHPRVWLRAVAASGLAKRPRIHDLRHSHASWLIAAGVPLPVIQYRLGHESIKTSVDRYGHLLPGAGELAAASMEKVFSSLTVPLSGELLPRDELERSDAPDAPND